MFILFVSALLMLLMIPTAAITSRNSYQHSNYIITKGQLINVSNTLY